MIEAWDYNNLASDSHFGSMMFSVKSMLSTGAKPGGYFIWKNLYGSPKDNTGPVADAMNQNPDIASDWKGQVLIHISAVETDKPMKGVIDLDFALKEEAKEKGYF